jgi:hypothetical protein
MNLCRVMCNMKKQHNSPPLLSSKNMIGTTVECLKKTFGWSLPE